ncbi:MAG: helix-turn-helix transcriptional regulator [Bacteroidales bacterium]|nr:helix-turn-helix transcriptional regulator [Bacteroidales bacterium]
MSLSDRIRKVYRSNCNSIEEFAELIDVSESSVHKWFSGEVVPRKDKLSRICQRFGVSIEWLEYGIEAVNDKETKCEHCSSCTEKDRLISHLEERLNDKDIIIDSLRDQLKMYKHQQDDYTDKSKQA